MRIVKMLITIVCFYFSSKKLELQTRKNINMIPQNMIVSTCLHNERLLIIVLEHMRVEYYDTCIIANINMLFKY